MALWQKIVGTFSATFQLGKAGPKLKNNSGVIEHRDAADAAYAVARGADPVIGDDLVTKRYGDAHYGGGGSSTPTTIAAGTPYSIASGAQVVFTEEIAVDGELSVDGVLAGTF